MRTILLLVLLPGCVYRSDPPFDGGVPDAYGCCDLAIEPALCCPIDPSSPFSRGECVTVNTAENCGGCGVRCSAGEACFDPGWADGVRLTPECRPARP